MTGMKPTRGRGHRLGRAGAERGGDDEPDLLLPGLFGRGGQRWR